ncbi:MAG: DUF58 domain-containing protein [Elusimicrobia bacterium]|nr:DUF58 domain-containing protein [Elusimicrobiota bacterium]
MLPSPLRSAPRTSGSPGGTLSASDILKQVRRIEIKTGRLVSETFAGEYLSVFKGRGMEFSEVREYSPGDDIRSIDWNVTARTGKPFIKRYVEERELTVVLACDYSGSLGFGTREKLKSETAAELGAILAFSAMQNNDKVGLALFTDQVERFIPPRKGRFHNLRLIRELLTFRPTHIQTNITESLKTISRMLKRRAILFLVSDFIDSNFEPALRQLSMKHDLIPVILEDPVEREIPTLPVFLDLQDSESGKRYLVDAKSSPFKQTYRSEERKRRTSFQQFLKNSGMDAIFISTGLPVIDPVVRFFRQRAKKFR